MANWIGLYTLIRAEVERTFRVVIQTLITPWITALLYIFIFGFVVGRKIELIEGVPYINFVLPGILMMSVLMGSFTASSNALYFKRFIRSIEELLVAPISYLEMVIGLVVSAVLRSFIIALGIFVIALLFGGATVTHFGLFVFYTVSVSVIFALLGMVVGLWSKGFEQLNVLSAFVITPLSFLGGVFYSINMLPEKARIIALYNPIFYFIDGIRYSMIGIQESNQLAGLIIIFGSILILGTGVWYLFKIGWRIRE